MQSGLRVAAHTVQAVASHTLTQFGTQTFGGSRHDPNNHVLVGTYCTVLDSHIGNNLGNDSGATMKKRKQAKYPEMMDCVMLGVLILWAVVENWTRITILIGEHLL